MPTVKEIFDVMPEKFDPEAAGDWNAVVQFKVAGEGGGNWNVTVQNKTCAVVEGEAASPTCTIETDAETYVGTSTGTINSQTAFFSGKIKIAGNMSDAMKINQVFKRA